MNEAHVFQHKFTGLQMFVYHEHSEADAKSELACIVIDYQDWTYLGNKVAIDVN